MPTTPPSGSPTRLPGVGLRLDVTDTDARAVAVVRRNSGHVELHLPGAAGPVELEPACASAVGSFMSGHYALPPSLADRLEHVLGGLVVDWVRVAPGDHVVGRTIGELAVRERTGVLIVAVLRGSVPLVAPDPGLRLEAGDDLVIAARDGDRDAFERFVAGGP